MFFIAILFPADNYFTSRQVATVAADFLLLAAESGKKESSSNVVSVRQVLCLFNQKKLSKHGTNYTLT
jgi:hypothetical protein